MAGKITKFLLVLAILQYALRADAQAVKTTAEVLTQYEGQRSQTTWLAKAGRITKILVLLGILQYAVRVDLPSVKVTEEILRQHEKERVMEMTQLLVMEQKMKKQHGLTPGRMLLLACQEWWFWVGAEILLVLFGIYWLPRQRDSDCDDGSQWETSTGAQEQIEENCEDNPDSDDPPEKPPDKVRTPGAFAKPFPGTTFLELHPAVRAGNADKYLNACKDMIDPLLLLPLRPLIVHFFH
ncbi:uncharacterized protein LOC120749373 isoform X1 [Hirundo rustica]|uniref:uncharacterized protein LOC120749373 isoform X1 n=1 Tax=Hirundo rustica TaxID=43150 RepID=UPI001A94D8E9|nr:uncharacterized protein LOC120749373 isoform X1 [Hirundo rustica]